MKTNLKTLKEACKQDEECWDNSAIWKALEAFEKELREIKANLDKLDAPFTVMSVQDFQRLIKEVLGDE